MTLASTGLPMSVLSPLEKTSPATLSSLAQAPLPSALTRILAGLADLQESPGEVTGDDWGRFDGQLGLASSLFTALRAKHVASAQHSLRVAVRCSAFARSLGMTEEERSLLEVAALLHDIGNIGIPDQLLQKPARLTDDEAIVFEQNRRIGLEILSKCCLSDMVLQAVRYCDCWYDGSRPAGVDRRGEDQPLLARILTIVNAFDSMTTDRVYRRALSRERAMAELYAGAGTQFDPKLVQLFADLPPQIDPILAHELHRRTDGFEGAAVTSLWKLRQPLFGEPAGPTSDNLFLQRLVDNMYDGLIFVNITGQITFWNRGIERLSGIPAASIYEKAWTAALLDLRDPDGNLVRDNRCPVLMGLHHGTQSLQRYSVRRHNHKRTTVDVHVIPVMDHTGQSYGATVIIHDVSSETNLEQRVEHLQRKATHDPLTSVANRAEFDRKLTEYVDSHLKAGIPCSLIICDIDRFKQINDTYGHQAGDEALIGFAKLLKSHCRSEDVVARYGGEEFVLLCPDCDGAAAYQRAESLRSQLAQLDQPALGGRAITASFGVTEIQAGDSPETMLRRADRALLEAKDGGRNCVVQNGTGLSGGDEQRLRLNTWFGWWKTQWPEAVLRRQLVAKVPRYIATEKLRGFVADHSARVIKVAGDHVVLELEAGSGQHERRAADRRYGFIVELELGESSPPERLPSRPLTHTTIQVSIRPKRQRDRRSAVHAAAQNLLTSLRSYLVAHETVG